MPPQKKPAKASEVKPVKNDYLVSLITEVLQKRIYHLSSKLELIAAFSLISVLAFKSSIVPTNVTLRKHSRHNPVWDSPEVSSLSHSFGQYNRLQLAIINISNYLI